MTFVKTALFHKAGEGSGGGGGDQHNLGWYATESALTTAHATASDGDWAIVGATDTVWVWDSDTTAWKDTGQAGIELPDQTGHSGEFLTTDGTDASWAAVNALPSQTGQSGKFLTTDGTDASWSDKPLVNTATGTDSLTISGTPTSVSYGAINIGPESVCDSIGVALGRYAEVRNASNSGVAVGNGSKCHANRGIVVGNGKVTANNAIQLGCNNTQQTNSDANTMKVTNANGNFEMMSADGTIPTARLTKVNTTITLAAADWSSNTQTVSVTGMTATGIVMVSPDPTDQSAYTSAGIICSAQGTNSLTFTATTTPVADIDVNVVCL